MCPGDRPTHMAQTAASSGRKQLRSSYTKFTPLCGRQMQYLAYFCCRSLRYTGNKGLSFIFLSILICSKKL